MAGIGLPGPDSDPLTDESGERVDPLNPDFIFPAVRFSPSFVGFAPDPPKKVEIPERQALERGEPWQEVEYEPSRQFTDLDNLQTLF